MVMRSSGRSNLLLSAVALPPFMIDVFSFGHGHRQAVASKSSR